MEKHFIYQCVFIICTLGSIICVDGGTDSKHVFTYEGSGEAIFSCNGSDIINITDIHLSNHPTDCPRNMCNLTVSDRNHIEMCNGNSSCEIPIDELSPCIKDSGFYSIDYSCQKNVYYDFEDESYEWFLEENNWTIAEAKNQYPYRDHTTGSGLGHYMFVEPVGSFKSFYSLTIHGGFKQCLAFFYYIRDADDSIMLYIQHINGTNIQEVNITRPADANMWNKMILSIKDVSVYRIFIEERGKYKGSAFAVDDISIISKDCEEIRECDFEYGECNWTRSNRWYRIQGRTASRYTGPSKDHTTSGNGYYVYMEASNMTNWEKKKIESPFYSGTGKMCFTFWYYMYGNKMGSLGVYIRPESSTTSKLFSISGNQGKRWHAAYIDLHVYAKFVIIIQGQRGNGSKSDIAVDDISLIPGNCKGIVQHKQHCKSVNEKVELKECSKHYVSNIDVNFDPAKEFCKELFDENTNPVCNNYSYHVLCNVGNFTRQHPSCFNLTSLVIDYTCTELPNKPFTNKRSKDEDSTGVIVGVVIGLLLVIGVILGVLFIVHRRKNPKSSQNNKNAATWHSNSQPTHQTYRNEKIQTSNNGLATNRAANNPSYGQGYTIVASKQTKNKQDNEYMNITARNENLISQYINEEYKVLDPAKTGFNRNNQDEYELASPVNEDLDDNYAESGAGVYDISGNSRHKVKDTIYDHSIDDTYDTSNRGKHDDIEDYTYNHVFCKQTEDDYDIAGS